MTDTTPMPNVTCARCQLEKPALDAAPMPGPLGQEIAENVCAACWSEWREAASRIIAHYGLVLGNPAHRAQMRETMREFLGLDDDDD